MKYYAYRENFETFIRILPDGSIESYEGNGEWSKRGGTLSKMVLDTYYVELSKGDVVKKILK